MSNCVDIKVTTPKGVVEVPKDAIKGTICPVRKDYFQTECWRCDLCGRNEAYEHGASFETVQINGFKLYEEAINTKNSKIEDGWYIFQYGYKEMHLNIKYLDEWCGWSLEEIHNAIVKFRENDTYKIQITNDEFDSVEDYDGPIFLYLDGKEYGPFNTTPDDAVIMLIGDYTESQHKTFVHLIEWQEENHMSLADWEDLYGYDI